MQKAAGERGRSGRKRRPRAQWAADIGAWKRSGLDADEYAASKGFNPRTFAWWIRELRAGGSASVSLTEANSAASAKAHFLPLRVVDDEGQLRRGGCTLTVEIDLANGRRIRVQVQRDEDLQRVAALVAAVEGRA